MIEKIDQHELNKKISETSFKLHDQFGGNQLASSLAAISFEISEILNNKIDEINKEIYRLGVSNGQNSAYIEGIVENIKNIKENISHHKKWGHFKKDLL